MGLWVKVEIDGHCVSFVGYWVISNHDFLDCDSMELRAVDTDQPMIR
jgi:hypothetical protein